MAGLGTIASAADSIWNLGWGYKGDVGIWLLMFGCGIIFWSLWHGALKLSEWLNEMMYGPGPSKKDD